MFNMPDEVIWELSNDDDHQLIERSAEELRAPDRWVELRQNPVCNQCGYRHVEWARTKHGWRLVYTQGALKGKVHACDR